MDIYDNIYDIYDIYDVLGSKDINKKERYESINIDINNILNKYYKNEEEVLFKSFKDDMIFVLILDKIAIKIYSTRKFESVRELYDLLKKNDNPNLEYIYEIIYNDNYVIVVSETLEIDGAIKKFTEDDMNEQIIYSALKYLHDNGWIHGDASLDNIGYRKNSICNKEYNIECFVLYDFEKSKKIDHDYIPSNDLYSIRKSFTFNKSIKDQIL